MQNLFDLNKAIADCLTKRQNTPWPYVDAFHAPVFFFTACLQARQCTQSPPLLPVSLRLAFLLQCPSLRGRPRRHARNANGPRLTKHCFSGFMAPSSRDEDVALGGSPASSPCSPTWDAHAHHQFLRLPAADDSRQDPRLRCRWSR